jgi:hypothetical protein
MPLAFESISHGTVAFGFFNIESDMLLLEHYFFFSTVFCQYLGGISQQSGNDGTVGALQGYSIDTPEKIGDLMGAIKGVRYTGFIGELYRRYPFPPDSRDFKQNPRGVLTQGVVDGLIAPYAVKMDIPFICNSPDCDVAIGEYRFKRTGIHRLIEYVWKGGYPRWKNGTRPDYVQAMKSNLMRSRYALFKGLVLDG